MEPIILNNSVIKHKISILRDKKTGTKEFRELVGEISMLLCYEAFKNVDMLEKQVETPITKTTGYEIDTSNYVFIPILRAGMGMVDGIIRIFPDAKFGHIGLFRNEETLEPIEYYCKLPKQIEEKEVFIIDPMLATGGSGVDAISQIKKRGVKKVTFLCIIAAPEGIKKIQETYPDVQIYCATMDEKLNENGYIVPGLGDAGDRIYGHK